MSDEVIDVLIERRYIDLNQAAIYLALSPKTLYTWAAAGTIPAHKLGRLWRFDRAEQDAFVHRSLSAGRPFCYNPPQSSRSAADLGRKGQ